jgi:nucleotide-binding universal stress UspA family protein
MIRLSNILLPTDFSDASLTATRYAVQLAKRFSSRLHVLHVIEDPVVYLPMFESYPLPSREEFELYAQTRLDNWIVEDDADHLDQITHWVHGTPFLEILKYAKEESADMIVLGTHGRGLAAHLLLGSVAERIVRKAPCPVLTVRPEGHQFVHPGV